MPPHCCRHVPQTRATLKPVSQFAGRLGRPPPNTRWSSQQPRTRWRCDRPPPNTRWSSPQPRTRLISQSVGHVSALTCSSQTHDDLQHCLGGWEASSGSVRRASWEARKRPPGCRVHDLSRSRVKNRKTGVAVCSFLSSAAVYFRLFLANNERNKTYCGPRGPRIRPDWQEECPRTPSRFRPREERQVGPAAPAF